MIAAIPAKCVLSDYSVFSVNRMILPIFCSEQPIISQMKRHTFRVVTRGPEGEYRIRDYVSEEEVRRWHVQTGISDCSLDVSLRGRPIFKGLIGPMPEVGGVLRYESPEVFEQLTKEWAEHNRRCRRRKKVEKQH